MPEDVQSSAKTSLSKLIEAMLSGEGTKPVVRLVPVTQGAFKIGLLEGKLGTGPDFFEPIDEADLDLWEGGR